MKNVAIIGAGACGMLLANLLCNDFDVTLFDKNNKLGKKILASGNGKCNFTNVGDYKNKYNNQFAYDVVNKYNNSYLREYLSNLGLIYRIDEENRAYPLSESSISVLDVLKKGLSKVKILLDSKVIKIEEDNEKIKVYYNKEVQSFDCVVCCSGSNASNLGSEYAYEYLKNYGLAFTNMAPSLVPVIVKEDLHSMSGVRVKCLVKLYKNGEYFYKEKGEVLFKDDSLSGIVIYNISSIINRDKKANYRIKLDLINDAYNEGDYSSLIGVVHPKIIDYLNKYESYDLRNIEFNVIGLKDKKDAQVISGGVSIDQLNSDLSLKKNRNIYLGGEVIDCDGMCGGYNLQFAFSSAFLIAESIKKTMK